MTATLDTPTVITAPGVYDLPADVEPPTCQWEYYLPYRSGQPVEGCDNDALPGHHFCARHLPDEDY